MTSGGVEALKAAVRRSLPLLVGLIVLGIVAVNVFEQVRGPQYEATAKVVVTSTPLAGLWNTPAAIEARDGSKLSRLCGPAGPVTCVPSRA